MSPIATPACVAVAFLPIATPEPEVITDCNKVPALSFVGPGSTLAPSPKDTALSTFVEALGPYSNSIYFAVAPSFNLFPASLEFIETYLNLTIDIFT